MDEHEFSSGLPTLIPALHRPGDLAYDEGVYVCVTCNLPAGEVSLLPGDLLPECLECGEGARWVKT